MKNEKHRLLIINYDFPPAGGAGVKRCLKFMKYLGRKDWEIHVLTVRNGSHGIVDASLLKEVSPDVKIHRSFTFESLFTRKSIKNPNASGVYDGAGSGWSSRKLIKNVLGKIYIKYGYLIKIPDSRILWIPGALFLFIRLMRKNGFEVVFTTGPTFVNGILAAIIKTFYKRPMVIDFRDAWLADPITQSDDKRTIKLQRMLERFVIEKADMVISTNPNVTDDFRRRYPSGNENKYDTIYNGYDYDDVDFIDNEKQFVDTEKLSIVYSGRLYAERSPKSFLDALKLAVDERPEIKKKICVYFVGSCEKYLDGKYIEDYIEENKLHELITLTGHISRTDSLLYQKQGHILLMLIGIVPKEFELTYGISGKIFDYLMLNKQILTLANNGASRNFIMQNKIGDIFYHHDIEGIKDYLLRSYEKYMSNGLMPGVDPKQYQEFAFEKLTDVLDNHFKTLLKR